jgi:hypothetical protein
VAPLPEQGDLLVDARFGEGMRLRAVALPDRALAPGDILPVSLFWQAERAIDQPYKVTLQLLGGQGDLVAQVDTAPRDGLAPTTSWQTGDLLVDRYGVYLPPDLLSGRYTLVVAAYHTVTGERLRVNVDGQAVGDHLLLAQVTVGAHR